MQKTLGISVYLGLDIDIEKNLEYLQLAAQLGYTHVFTSLHIPEANGEKLLNDFKVMMGLAKELSLQVTADISPRTLDLLGCSFEDLSPLHRMGLSGVRFDFGFSVEEIAKATRESDLKIEINASTADANLLNALLEAGANLDNLHACHNFYPRPETGLGYSLFAERSQLCKQLGIRVLAFIPSLNHPRAPLYEGLPTLESHRYISPLVAAKHLWASNLVDTVVFGDPLASTEELQAVSTLDTEVIVLAIRPSFPLDALSAGERLLLSMVHTNRMDPGESVIRSQESRTVVTSVPPRTGGGTRVRGTVTVDNDLYARYHGELQITLVDLPENSRINTIATVVPEELFLLEFVKPGRKFRFEIKE
jgi:hypothetical protein